MRDDAHPTDTMVLLFPFAATSAEQVRRHFSEEAPHQQGPGARILRLRRLGPRQARREQQQQQHDDGPRRRAPQAQAAADGIPPASPSTARLHVGVARRSAKGDDYSLEHEHPRESEESGATGGGANWAVNTVWGCMRFPVWSSYVK